MACGFSESQSALRVATKKQTRQHLPFGQVNMTYRLGLRLTKDFAFRQAGGAYPWRVPTKCLLSVTPLCGLTGSLWSHVRSFTHSTKMGKDGSHCKHDSSSFNPAHRLSVLYAKTKERICVISEGSAVLLFYDCELAGAYIVAR